MHHGKTSHGSTHTHTCEYNIYIRARLLTSVGFSRGDHLHSGGEYRHQLKQSLVTLTEDGRLTWLGVSPDP
jgi:hypothetical protein